ncbi:MAG: tRNA (adenosine(37)-N6)-threonylcarbamoyltransferase complex ATPase subunit type 1 TsaE [Endomicrobium sp.]|jgi:tRNA threonylcarbamoyladenosine biosynthesis protein TsaE|nr:tRNA (adenosine(37)-N6)-threonylcarbamoyltransferase complex ATPase subunit type 1 TsaE [Endomicrobium sp.]
MGKNKRSNIWDINISKQNIFVTKNPDETRNLGERFASVLRSSDIVFLNGDLGSGKTIFAQGVIKAFGNKGFAKSSSFIIVNEYNAGDLKLFHFDLYRLEPSNILDIGIEEYIYSKNISLIEWADRLIGSFNDSYWNVEIEDMGSIRKIKIEKKYENFSCRNFRKNV